MQAIKISKDKIRPRILGAVIIDPNCGPVIVVKEIEGKFFLDEAFFIKELALEGEGLDFYRTVEDGIQIVEV
jgi:hypothetical protein